MLTGPFISLYNTLMKVFFIGSAGYVVYLMKFKFKCVRARRHTQLGASAASGASGGSSWGLGAAAEGKRS